MATPDPVSTAEPKKKNYLPIIVAVILAALCCGGIAVLFGIGVYLDRIDFFANLATDPTARAEEESAPNSEYSQEIKPNDVLPDVTLPLVDPNMADAERAMEVLTTDYPGDAAFFGEWTREQRELYMTALLLPEFTNVPLTYTGPAYVTELVEGESSRPTAYQLNLKEAGESLAVVIPNGVWGHLHLVGGALSAEGRIVFVSAFTPGEIYPEAQIAAGTVGLNHVLNVVAGIDLCEKAKGVLEYGKSNGDETFFVGATEACDAQAENVNPEIGEKRDRVSEATGVDLIAVGHILDGLAVWGSYSAGNGTFDALCPAPMSCLGTYDGTTWAWLPQDVLQSDLVGFYVFDTGMFLTSEERYRIASELTGTVITAPEDVQILPVTPTPVP